ncbi:hypothetical protein [Methyloversatilis thermotolerans]|uniref:hypothetical protein n=1 Tax=Methyloversatilis thermotolerans TaxID=1346290 RepID=UPI00037CB74B|nr:hypothetical protein [Methyloversatilis thermotolerans]
MKKLMTRGVVLPLVAALPCLWFWYVFHLTLEFDEQGRHVDAAAGTVHTDASFVWGAAASGLLLLALINALRALRRHD